MLHDPLVAKKIYVPLSARGDRGPSKPTAPPAELALLPAGRVMRLVAWTGVAVSPADPAPVVAAPEPLLSARETFARIPWSGAQPTAPTETQAASSAASILGRFKWE